MTFVAKTKSAEEWRAVAGGISTLVDEATFSADKDGISFRAMDPSRIALVDVFWPNSAFESYQCDSAVKFGLRVDEFNKLLKRADKKDAVEIGLADSELLLKLEGSYSKQYKTKLIESSASETPLPKPNFNAKAVMPVAMFDKLMSDVAVVSEFVSFNIVADVLSIFGKGDSGEAKIDLAKDSLGVEELSAKEASHATYSLDYISKIVKAATAAGGSMTAEFSSKMPLRLAFPVANVGRIHFFLAPRVQE